MPGGAARGLARRVDLSLEGGQVELTWTLIPLDRVLSHVCEHAAETRAIERAGVPDVAATWAHEIGHGRSLLAIAITQRYPGHARQAGHCAAMCDIGTMGGKYVVVTDEDVDLSDLDQLTWAMNTRSDPATSIGIIHEGFAGDADPRIEPEARARGQLTGSRAIIDACRPFYWKTDFPTVNAPSLEVARRAEEKFGHLMDGD